MSVMEGKHTVDVGMLLIPVIMEMLMLIGDRAEIKYTTGMERNKDIEIQDSVSEAAFAKFQKQLGKDTKEEEVVEEQTVEQEEEEPMGLMARRN